MTREQLRNGAVAAFVGASALLAYGLLSATGDGSGLYGELTPPDAPTPTVCVYREGYTDPATLGLWVPDYSGGSAYALVQVCVDEDALEDEGEEPLLPAEYAALPPDPTPPTPYVPGEAHMKVWVQGHPDAPFACACSSGSQCSQDGVEAPLGLTLRAGSWAGEGCVPKPCVEWAGISSWPSQCPEVP